MKEYILIATYNFLDKDNYESTTHTVLVKKFTDLNEVKELVKQDVYEVAKEDTECRFGYEEDLTKEEFEKSKEYFDEYVKCLTYYEWGNEVAQLKYDVYGYTYDSKYFVFEV